MRQDSHTQVHRSLFTYKSTLLLYYIMLGTFLFLEYAGCATYFVFTTRLSMYTEGEVYGIWGGSR